jgi:hypothetical protein
VANISRNAMGRPGIHKDFSNGCEEALQACIYILNTIVQDMVSHKPIAVLIVEK